MVKKLGFKPINKREYKLPSIKLTKFNFDQIYCVKNIRFVLERDAFYRFFNYFWMHKNHQGGFLLRDTHLYMKQAQKKEKRVFRLIKQEFAWLHEKREKPKRGVLKINYIKLIIILLSYPSNFFIINLFLNISFRIYLILHFTFIKTSLIYRFNNI